MPRDLFEYVLQPEMQKLLGHFSSLPGVRTGFFSLTGEAVFIGKDLPSCAYCTRLRQSPDVDARCKALDRKMFSRARRLNVPVSYTCHGGLTEAVVPVAQHGRCLGFVMIGQFRTHLHPARSYSHSGDATPLPPSPPPAFLRQIVPEKLSTELLRLYKRTPVFSRNQVEDMLQLLRLLVEHIARHSLVNLKDFDLVQPLLEQIENNPGATLSIAEAAARIGRSPSSLSQRFRKLTGDSFRRYQIRRKLQEAKQLLETFPHLPVKDVAQRAGFEDPLYFSRVFRKHFGVSPSAKKKGKGERERGGGGRGGD
ncbi:MAG: PocR ligand-binding domain-containing protein [Opitutaceae bacterium]|jgi:AraC-like DNA-binding protein|nr:PocR ligand-binding domain-containing protein [Opitutaceae bacterium]